MYIDSLRKPYVKHENILESAESFHIFEDIREDDFSETFCNEDHLIKISDELLSGFENNVHVEAFRMNVIDDIGYKEIALIQNVAIGTIKSRVYRGKKLLRDKYIQICNQEACLLV
jgi:DNA-directed RNA polymerase specialized sigma24 family protein